MRSVAVVAALAVETQVAGRGHEESLQQVTVRKLVQLRRHVQRASGHGHRASETKEPAGKKRDQIKFSRFKMFFF